MKNILRYLSIFLATLFLVGCSPKEMSKTYSNEIDSNLYVETTFHYKEKSDLVDKQETRNTFKNLGERKDKFKENLEKDKERFGGFEGVEFKYEENSDDIVVIFNFDYSKVDLDRMIQERVLPSDVLSEDKKTVSLEKLENSLKELGWQEKK